MWVTLATICLRNSDKKGKYIKENLVQRYELDMSIGEKPVINVDRCSHQYLLCEIESMWSPSFTEQTAANNSAWEEVSLKLA
jgi:hypothetical protein